MATSCSDGGPPTAPTAATAEVPSDYASLSDEDREVLDALVEQGADLSERRKVRHYLYLDTQARAASAADEAEAEGWKVTALQPDDAVPEWSVEAVQELALTAEQVSGHPSSLIAWRGKRTDGVYDGREAAVS